MICEPLELEYLYAALTDAGHEPELLDMMCERRALIDLLRDIQPDVVVFTSYITHVNVIKQYAHDIKTSFDHVPTIVGGLHAEVNPQHFEHPAIDFIVCQNGVKSVCAIVDSLANATSTTRIIAEIPGVWNGDSKRDKSEYPPTLPLPARHASQRYRHRYNYLFHNNVALLKTSYGCPYQCEFCYCRVLTDGTYSTRPLDEVMNELASIQEPTVFIIDDDFLLTAKRVEQFCDELERRCISKRYILFGRTDFIAKYEAVVERFASLGLHAVFIGAESFRQSDLEHYHKKNSVEITEQAAAVLHKHNVEPYVGIVIGPDWTSSDFRGLSRWMREHKLELANIQPLTPMPGTRCYDEYEDRLIVDPNRHDLFDMTHLVVQPTAMSKRRFYFELVRTYYETTTSPRTVYYILRRYGIRVWLRMVRGGLHITWQYLKLMAKG